MKRFALLLCLLLALPGCNSGCLPPAPPKPPVVVPAQKATAVTYIYEKDDTAIPVGVKTGIDRLNREKNIVATMFEDDTPDGSGEVPEQYKAALAAAKEAGLPAAVATAGHVVVKVVKNPRSESELMSAAE